jgi:hypothetical protein
LETPSREQTAAAEVVVEKPKSADCSLQLAGALQNFATWKEDQDGVTVDVSPPATGAAVLAATPSPSRKVKVKIYPVVRDQQ